MPEEYHSSGTELFFKDITPANMFRDLIPAYRSMITSHPNNDTPEMKELMFSIDLLENSSAHAPDDDIAYAVHMLPDQLQFDAWSQEPELIPPVIKLIDSVREFLISPTAATRKTVLENLVYSTPSGR